MKQSLERGDAKKIYRKAAKVAEGRGEDGIVDGGSRIVNVAATFSPFQLSAFYFQLLPILPAPTSEKPTAYPLIYCLP
jgi:hypothetical protein